MIHSNAVHKNALQVIQESIGILVKWANVEVAPPLEVTDNPVVTCIKEILRWQSQVNKFVTFHYNISMKIKLFVSLALGSAIAFAGGDYRIICNDL
ncbi:hypothetical protein F7734_40535 [Scytonema sp. UIC 10036]|uniref:hypothetical protein n=1 Tax=Scytonema sp. UIC 10036 TaxID=2304196 RepID=UPI0012DA09ED|nr:hypothetical protein [Scytonema sp. UIC 10036]MUG98264.1 hypothetical protein [Scytonema sp. UIC 10036]